MKKKFIVKISEGWNGLRFEFSKQDDACKFMGEAVNSSIDQVKCTLEVKDITNEENRIIKKPTIYNDFTVGMMLTFYELMDMCPEYHAELYVESGAIYDN